MSNVEAMDGTFKKTITFYCEPELQEKMKSEADRRDLTISQFLRKLIRRELTGEENKSAKEKM